MSENTVAAPPLLSDLKTFKELQLAGDDGENEPLESSQVQSPS